MKYVYTGELEDGCVDADGTVVKLIPNQIVELARVQNRFINHLVKVEEVVPTEEKVEEKPKAKAKAKAKPAKKTKRKGRKFL
jgi:DNA-binding protein H-NS